MDTGRKPGPKILTYVLLGFWAITTIYPFVWVLLNSFRKKGLIISDSFSLPLGELDEESCAAAIAAAIKKE